MIILFDSYLVDIIQILASIIIIINRLEDLETELKQPYYAKILIIISPKKKKKTFQLLT